MFVQSLRTTQISANCFLKKAVVALVSWAIFFCGCEVNSSKILIPTESGQQKFYVGKDTLLDIQWFKNGQTVIDQLVVERALDFVVQHQLKDVTLFFPKGVYTFSVLSKQKYCIKTVNRLHFKGETKAGETVFKLAEHQPEGTILMQVEGNEGVVISNITFDGQYEKQSVEKPKFFQLHAIRVHQSNQVVISNCQFFNTSGDGVYIDGVEKSSTGVTIQDCKFDYNQRNGVTLGSGFENIKISRNYFGENIIAQPIDTEPPYEKAGKNVVIDHNSINRKADEHTRLTVTMVKFEDSLVSNYSIINNVLNNCSIYLCNAKDVKVIGNKIKCRSPQSDKDAPITLWGRVENVLIEKNEIEAELESAIYAKYIQKKDRQPKNIQIVGNVIMVSNEEKPAICLEIPDGSCQVIENRITFKGKQGRVGVQVKTFLNVSPDIRKNEVTNLKKETEQLQDLKK